MYQEKNVNISIRARAFMIFNIILNTKLDQKLNIFIKYNYITLCVDSPVELRFHKIIMYKCNVFYINLYVHKLIEYLLFCYFKYPEIEFT